MEKLAGRKIATGVPAPMEGRSALSELAFNHVRAAK